MAELTIRPDEIRDALAEFVRSYEPEAASTEEVGIVAEPPGIEGVEWSARYRVSVEPQEQGAFRVEVTTQDGRLVFAGRGKRQDREATFELAAADVPGALPIEIRGRFDGQKLAFDQARSGVRRRPSQTPPAEGRAER